MVQCDLRKAYEKLKCLDWLYDTDVPVYILKLERYVWYDCSASYLIWNSNVKC